MHEQMHRLPAHPPRQPQPAAKPRMPVRRPIAPAGDRAEGAVQRQEDGDVAAESPVDPLPIVARILRACSSCKRDDEERCNKPLALSQPGDPLEKEADQVADRVMRTADPASRVSRARDDEEALLTRAEVPGTTSTGAASMVRDTLRSSGQPLSSATRAFMEPRIGRDFGDVRVHTDAQASRSAEAVSALAYTVGSNIVFRSGQYAPETPAGARLLAHELAHVAQRKHSTASPPPAPVQRAPDASASASGADSGPHGDEGERAEARRAVQPKLSAIAAQQQALARDRSSGMTPGDAAHMNALNEDLRVRTSGIAVLPAVPPPSPSGRLDTEPEPMRPAAPLSARGTGGFTSSPAPKAPAPQPRAGAPDGAVNLAIPMGIGLVIFIVGAVAMFILAMMAQIEQARARGRKIKSGSKSSPNEDPHADPPRRRGQGPRRPRQPTPRRGEPRSDPKLDPKTEPPVTPEPPLGPDIIPNPPEPDKDPQRECGEMHPGAMFCDPELQNREEVVRRWMARRGLNPDALRSCKLYKHFDPGDIDACEGAPGEDWHCMVRNAPTIISVFGRLCCAEDGTTNSNWQGVHISDNETKRGRRR